MDLVPFAQLRDHDSLGVVGRRLLHEGLMKVGIEGKAQRLDRLDAVLSERGEQLFLDHVQPRADALARGGPQSRRGALEIIDGFQQVAGQVADRVGTVSFRLLLGALLEIGELSPAA